MIRQLFLGLMVIFAGSGCDGTAAESATGDNVDTGDEDSVDDWDFTNGGPNCGFDAEKTGRNVGDQIANFGLKTHLQEDYWLHENCDNNGTKVVWMILATGWCGACEGYAPRAQELYEEYKEQGLEIMWILSETETPDEAVSYEWATEFVEDKGVTYPVMRDYKFLQVYGKIEPHSSSLPHMYVLDALTMELYYAQGGTDAAVESEVLNRL